MVAKSFIRICKNTEFIAVVVTIVVPNCWCAKLGSKFTNKQTKKTKTCLVTVSETNVLYALTTFTVWNVFLLLNECLCPGARWPIIIESFQSFYQLKKKMYCFFSSPMGQGFFIKETHNVVLMMFHFLNSWLALSCNSFKPKWLNIWRKLKPN